MSTINVDIVDPQSGPSVTVNGIIMSSYAGSNFNIGSLQAGMTVGANNNTSVGSSAGSAITTGFQNTALGTSALPSCTTGDNNVAIGPSSLQNLITGNRNISIGNFALYSNIVGNNSVAIGHEALKLYTGTPGQVAIGFNALATTATGINNTAIGVSALGLATGSGNTSVGHECLPSLTSGTGNTALGLRAGATFNSGSQNTIVGYQMGWTLTSGNNNVMLGTGQAGASYLSSGNNNILIGYLPEPSTPNVSNEITLGNSSNTVLRCAVTSITSLSDSRDKEEVAELAVGLEFVKELNPVSFVWNDRDESGKHGVKDFGFIAQDLKATQEKYDMAETLGLVYEENPEKLEASYGKLIPILVKAIQDLTAKVEALESKKKK